MGSVVGSWSALLVLCIGCGTPAVSLADLDQRVVSVLILAGGDNSSVGVLFDSVEERCPEVEPSVVVTLGGHLLSYAGASQTDPREGPPRCYLRFETSGPVVPEDGIVRIADDSLEIVATYDRAALEQRVATHPSWVFQRERRESVLWSHPSDLTKGPSSPSPWGSIIFGMIDPTFDVAIVPPNALEFTLPFDFPTGSFSVSVVVQNGYPDYAIECVNAEVCVAYQSRGDVHPAMVIP